MRCSLHLHARALEQDRRSGHFLHCGGQPGNCRTTVPRHGRRAGVHYISEDDEAMITWNAPVLCRPGVSSGRIFPCLLSGAVGPRGLKNRGLPLAVSSSGRHVICVCLKIS